jgi:hypothetical protein
MERILGMHLQLQWHRLLRMKLLRLFSKELGPD